MTEDWGYYETLTPYYHSYEDVPVTVMSQLDTNSKGEGEVMCNSYNPNCATYLEEMEQLRDENAKLQASVSNLQRQVNALQAHSKGTFYYGLGLTNYA